MDSRILRLDVSLSRAVLADSAEEPLGDHEGQGRRLKIRSTPMSIKRGMLPVASFVWRCGQEESSHQDGLDCDFGSVYIADLSNNNHVGISAGHWLTRSMTASAGMR